ncbi:hypothetical protein IE81DRAFT_312660 [Ceraceosorus guamensis]|uniref:Histone-lysine N-methyltransferase, H3 lysine-36 specific n=1 Tax=Ceraceosorus guamensis TaxID=1522189 RepID=A0A316W5Y9_9BASI|nr:hypothetical protein IE81DRAFT_312660 [Ceraceosorus guamensis]PWN43075.1 hypothetical protein IE81DRAFT_312660 [Ceraceosorus guamensis]
MSPALPTSSEEERRAAAGALESRPDEVEMRSCAPTAQLVVKEESDSEKPKRSKLRFQTPSAHSSHASVDDKNGLLPSDDEKAPAWDEHEDSASVGSSASESSSSASSSRSLSFEPKAEPYQSTASSSASPIKSAASSGPSKAPRRQPKEPARPPQLIQHLPLAEWEAMQTFDELPRNWYERAKLGRSKGQEEGMVCECRYRSGDDPALVACSEDSGCINRLTQVECLASDCQCKEHCQNQRFQRAQYANIEIVQTEKKGFGLRAANDLPADAFIYEYIGEVVEHKTFMKRMQQYAQEGVRHFYFMMLQREEYLDATKKGGKARFINHSCSPNCYVAKWHVGKHMRMGIFAQRSITAGEELTFNYNVDRYGHDAQECFCGEPNCVGTLGGKTQTDIGGMDQLYIDALGIAEEVDALEAKGSRRKKSRHLDEDFNPVMRPIEAHEVARVIAAVRQAQSDKRILQKLLERIHMTTDVAVQKALVRLHGFVLMAAIMEEWRDDRAILLLVMGSMARWPLIARNKVVDSGVDSTVRDLTSDQNKDIAELAQSLLDAWEALELSYRIARREVPLDADDSTRETPSWMEQRRADESEEIAVAWSNARAPNAISTSLHSLFPRPLGTLAVAAPAIHPPPRRRALQGSPFTPRTPEHASPAPVKPRQKSLEEIIRQANADAALQTQLSDDVARVEREREKERQRERKARKRSSRGDRERHGEHGSSSKRRKHGSASASSRHHSSSTDPEKKLRKLVGEVVVKCMSKYSDRLDRDVFKKHARDLTDVVCAKEMKHTSWPPAEGKLETLTAEKKTKMKTFANEYIGKLIARKGKPALNGDSSSAHANRSSSRTDSPPESRGGHSSRQGRPSNEHAAWVPDGDGSSSIVDEADAGSLGSHGTASNTGSGTTLGTPASPKAVAHFGLPPGLSAMLSVSGANSKDSHALASPLARHSDSLPPGPPPSMPTFPAHPGPPPRF